MIREILMHKMKNVLCYERRRSYKTIYSCEKKYVSNIETDSGFIYNLNCRIDRIDTDGKNYRYLIIKLELLRIPLFQKNILIYCLIDLIDKI